MKMALCIALFALLFSEAPARMEAMQQQPPATNQQPPAIKPVLPPATATDPAKADPSKIGEPIPAPGTRLPGMTQVNTSTYVIGAQDILAVRVWEDQRFSGSFLVLSDGFISIPLLGPIKAAGLTPVQLEGSINQALEKCCLQASHSNVQIEKVQSKKIYFDGEGVNPGPLDLAVETRLMDAISLKGGFREFADKKHIKINRDGKIFKTINYNDLQKGKHPELNIVLLPGDHIIVN